MRYEDYELYMRLLGEAQWLVEESKNFTCQDSGATLCEAGVRAIQINVSKDLRTSEHFEDTLLLSLVGFPEAINVKNKCTTSKYLECLFLPNDSVFNLF